jgi:YggT family protein
LAILYQVIRIGFELMQWLILGRVLLSWVNVGSNNRIAAFIYEVTEPILKPLRSLIHRGVTPLDFSPLLAIILLQFLERFFLTILF